MASAFSALSQQEDELSKEEFELARERGGVMTETDKEVLEDIVKAKQQIAAERARFAESPETAIYARMAELRTYQEGLQNGFAETPSVRKNMEWLREEWEFGKPSILEGHTGSWKSRLVFGLARKLYGRDPEYILCGERVGPPEVFGRMQLRAVGASDEKVLEVNAKIESQLNDWCEKNKLKEGASEDEVKEFARQYGEYNHRMIELFKQQIGVATDTYFTPGKFTRAIDQGAPLLNDEFNNMPLNMRMAYKLYYGFKAGRDEVVLQEDSGNAHPIKQGYAFTATANLKDDRHKERFKLDPAELRELDSLHIGYIPPEELYDLCLAKLMDKDGNADITKEESLIVLKNLCDAAKEIQTGYEREKGSYFKETNFTKQSIEEAVLDPNSVLKMLDGFNRTKSGDLKTHLEKGLLGFLAKGFPPADKKIVASWFIAKGFFQNKTAEDFGIKGLDDAMLQALKGAKKTEKEAEDAKSNQKQFLSLKELASLDPYEVRAEKWKQLGLGFFTNAPKPEGGDKPPETSDAVTFAEAKEIMPSNRFLGPEEIKQVFGIEIPLAAIPPILIPKEILEKLKTSARLILFAPKFADDSPVTALSIAEKFSNKKADQSPLLNLFNADDWKRKEDFFAKETPKLEWRLVLDEPIADSTSKNYNEQTKILADYLESLYDDKGKMPPEIRAAIEGARALSNNSDFQEVVTSGDASIWKPAAKKLADLPLNQEFRESFVELFYRFSLVDRAKAEQLLQGMYSWTNSRSSDGALVYGGGFDAHGAGASGDGPGDAGSGIGGFLSATKF